MSAQHSEPASPIAKPSAKTLDEVVRIMTGDVDGDFAERFQSAFKEAWATARAESSLKPLTNLVETWWPIAKRWSDPVGARAYYAGLDRVVRDGVPAGDRGNAFEAAARLEAEHGPSPALDKLRELAARW